MKEKKKRGTLGYVPPERARRSSADSEAEVEKGREVKKGGREKNERGDIEGIPRAYTSPTASRKRRAAKILGERER